MSDLRNLIRGYGEGLVFRRPEHMPHMLVGYSGTCRLKTSVSTMSYPYEAAFWTALVNRGAVAQVTTSDTWVTLCDVTGGGYLGWAMAPHSANGTARIRITADGMEKEFAYYTPNQFRLLVGSGWATLVQLATGTASCTGPLGSYYDYGYTSVTSTEVLRKIQYMMLSPADTMFICGLPVLRFDVGLKVEASTSINGLSGTDCNAGCSYCLDW